MPFDSSPQNHLNHLIRFQRPLIKDSSLYGKLDFDDLKRIDLYIIGDPIVSDKCCLFKGKTTSRYASISYRGKKVSILRLLCHNFIKDINPDDTIIYLCENPGLCCNIKHFDTIEKKKDPIIEEDFNLNTCFHDEEEKTFKMD